jgi:hypothetical protein
MHQFPEFMKGAANRIASTAQHTANVEGYVFDGADSAQVAFWECRADAHTNEHVHEFDEYFRKSRGRNAHDTHGNVFALRFDACDAWSPSAGTHSTRSSVHYW